MAPDPNGADATPTWGTVCGHWFWDNDEPANIVCRALGYESGDIYTYGTSMNARDLPTGARTFPPHLDPIAISCVVILYTQQLFTACRMFS